MKKVLITGANSYIGTSFEKYINEHHPGEFVIDTIDMVDGTWREKDFSGYDAVFHVAGIVHIKEKKQISHLYYEINRDLAFETAQKAKEQGVKQFVFLSSMSVYGLSHGEINNETPVNPVNAYGKSKLEAEKKLKSLAEAEFIVSIIRPPMVYGRGCKGNYQMLRKLALKLPVFPKVKNQRSMIYIDNLCEFVYAVIKDIKDGVFFPQNDELINTGKMVKTIAEANNHKIRITPVLTPFVAVGKIISGRIGRLCNKAFGSCYYDMEMSNEDIDYRVINSYDAVKEIEK